MKWMILLLLLAGCASTTPTTIISVKPPTPIIPSVDILKLRTIKWNIITSDNYQELLDNNTILYSISVEDYENLGMNIKDIQKLILQQQAIIEILKDSQINK